MRLERSRYGSASPVPDVEGSTREGTSRRAGIGRAPGGPPACLGRLARGVGHLQGSEAEPIGKTSVTALVEHPGLDPLAHEVARTGTAGLSHSVLQPVTLRGRIVRLEPMAVDHVDALTKVGLHPELWRWIPTQVSNRAEMLAYVKTALDELARGVSLPFVTLLSSTDQVIGSTRYGNIDLANRRVEIGWTWITPAYQRTGANTEAKLLLLTHAFETLKLNRVELKTDALNHRSRAAILRLGAVEEGTFRKHLVTSTGRIRDTVYFSIIDSEWPAVKARLSDFLRSRS